MNANEDLFSPMCEQDIYYGESIDYGSKNLLIDDRFKVENLFQCPC